MLTPRNLKAVCEVFVTVQNVAVLTLVDYVHCLFSAVTS